MRVKITDYPVRTINGKRYYCGPDHDFYEVDPSESLGGHNVTDPTTARNESEGQS